MTDELFTRIEDLPVASVANDEDLLVMTQGDDDKSVAVEKIRDGLFRVENNFSEVEDAAEARANLGIVSEDAWIVATEPTQMLEGRNYIAADNVDPVVFTLPETASVGSSNRIVGWGLAGFEVENGSGQTQFLGNAETTTGAAGKISSTESGDCVHYICVEEDENFVIVDSTGNFDLV